MSILIKNAKIIQPGGAHHLETKDILIEKGIISKIANIISDKARKTITGTDLHVSIGWMDIGAHSGEPGYEHRETLNSLKNAAASGGYTKIAVFPNTNPVMDNSTSLQWYKSNDTHVVEALPIGAISKGTDGKDLTEILDMNASGAIAFSDGLKSINDNGLLMRALQYVKSFNGLIIHHPNDKEISNHGEMHEGKISTSLGLTGIPTMAESSHVERDLSLLDYTNSRLLIHLISAEESVSTIKRSRKNKDNIFCSVSYMNLIFDDEALIDFDSNFKLNPPLRTQVDKKALNKGIRDGAIDLICSNHVPLEDELKKDAFPYTRAGAIGLQSCFSATWDHLKEHSKIEDLIEILSINPRTLIGIPIPSIKKNEPAELTIFDLDHKWIYSTKNNQSISSNNCFIGQQFGSKVLAVINGSKSRFAD